MQTSNDYAMWVQRSAGITLSVAVLIVGLKLSAAVQTNAAAALASFMDALLDVLVSLLHFVVLRYALKPADAQHRFGHGKAEALMALFQAAFLTAAAVLLLYQGGRRYVSPEPVGALDSGIWLTLGCTLLTLLLVMFQRLVIAKTGSLAVQADAAHYRSDLLMNAAVILAFYLVQNSLLWADAIIAVLIALYLFWNAQSLFRQSLVQLLDQELPEPLRNDIENKLKQLPQVLGIQHLRSRQSGPKVFIQLQLQLPAQLSLYEAHQIVDKAERIIVALFKDAEVLIHPEPANSGTVTVPTETD